MMKWVLISHMTVTFNEGMVIQTVTEMYSFCRLYPYTNFDSNRSVSVRVQTKVGRGLFVCLLACFCFVCFFCNKLYLSRGFSF